MISNHPVEDSQLIETTEQSPQTARDNKQRWQVYLVLISCSVAIMIARLMTIESQSYGLDVPFFSANDRSRWCTIRALGDENTFALDTVLQSENGKNWDSIDKVMHPGRDGKPHFYSSKPTLLPWLLAYEYIAVKNITGKNLTDNPFFVVRCMLLLSQIVPLAICLVLIAKIADDLAITDWAKLFVVACATFATFLTTFSITLTNHVPATVSSVIVLWALIQLWRHDSRKWLNFLLAGLFSAFAAANDLPALSLCALAFGLCLIKSPLKTVVGFIPPAALVAAGFFWTNYLAHNEWKPAYAHRDDGKAITSVSGDFAAMLDDAILPNELSSAIVENADKLGATIQTDSIISRGYWPTSKDVNRWLIDNPDHSSRVVIVNKPVVIQNETGEKIINNVFSLHRWNNWYEYPGSYWSAENADKSRVDRGTRSKQEYATHMLIGHHGVFSLSPIWLWSIPGVLILCVASEYRIRLLAIGIVLISIAVIWFYINRPELDRAYGGVSSGPRWLFWLIPLWLVAMIPFLDRIHQWGAMKLLVMITLFISAGSAAYAWKNPWVHPWIYEKFFGGG